MSKTSVTQGDIEQLLGNGKKIVFIDVRSKAEFEEKHIPDALSIPVEEIEAGRIPLRPDENTILVTACGKGGGRSERAAIYLRENAGFEAYFLDGGTFGWYDDHE